MATDTLTPILTSMLAVASAAVAPTGRQIISPGPPAFDDCCSGQVWVRLINLVPGAGIAGQAYRSTIQTPCGVLDWQATFGIGVIRCAHTVDDQGRAPTSAQITGDALAVIADMLDLSEAIQCVMSQIPNMDKVSMGRWDTIAPEGGCVGGEWTFTAFVPNCRCGT